MQPFTLVVPHDLDEAAAAAKPATAMLKAAGLDLLDRLKEGVATPGELVSLLPLKRDLAGIGSDAKGLSIGALTTLAELAEAKALDGAAFAALRTAADQAATPQIRNRATVAGNLLQQCRCWYLRSAAFACLHGGKGPICLAIPGENRYHAIFGVVDCARVHPSNLAPALLALGAEFTSLANGKPVRRPLAELFPSEPKAQAAEHTLQQGEILTAIHLPAPPAGARSAYAESREKQSFDWPTTAAAVRLVLDGGRITEAAIVLGAVAPVPWPRPQAAAMLVGKAPSAELFEQVAKAAFADAQALEHNAYKIPIGQGVLRSALHEAAR